MLSLCGQVFYLSIAGTGFLPHIVRIFVFHLCCIAVCFLKSSTVIMSGMPLFLSAILEVYAKPYFCLLASCHTPEELRTMYPYII